MALLYFYLLSIVEFVAHDNERNLRLASVICFCAGILAIYVSALLLPWHSDVSTRRLMAWFAAWIFALSPLLLETAIQISPISFMPSCHLFRWRPIARYTQSRSTRVLILGAVFLAFAIMTIEYAVLLCLTYVICLYVDGRQNGYPLKSLCIDLLKVCGVVIFVIICLWPAGIFKLSLVKITFFCLLCHRARRLVSYAKNG